MLCTLFTVVDSEDSDDLERNQAQQSHRFLCLTVTPIVPSLEARHEMGAMGLGERFPFALERDDVRARRWA
jgi:hypothetical protein